MTCCCGRILRARARMDMQTSTTGRNQICFPVPKHQTYFFEVQNFNCGYQSDTPTQNRSHAQLSRIPLYSKHNSPGNEMLPSFCVAKRCMFVVLALACFPSKFSQGPAGHQKRTSLDFLHRIQLFVSRLCHRNSRILRNKFGIRGRKN